MSPDRRRRGFVEPFESMPSAGARIGLLERVRARFSRLESEFSSSLLPFSSAIVSGCGDLARAFRAAERVKYPSCCSDDSDGVGDGEITRGVEGMGYVYDIAVADTSPTRVA